MNLEQAIKNRSLAKRNFLKVCYSNYKSTADYVSAFNAAKEAVELAEKMVRIAQGKDA